VESDACIYKLLLLGYSVQKNYEYWFNFFQIIEDKQETVFVT